MYITLNTVNGVMLLLGEVVRSTHKPPASYIACTLISYSGSKVLKTNYILRAVLIMTEFMYINF